ncbi:MAG TPA: ABC transporter ATP-binding protein [Ignavibacteria bacterium]
MAIIELKNVDKIYNSKSIPVQALKNINLKINSGEFTAIVGPSGSGKTTLLNILGSLDSVTSGEVILNNKKISEMKENQLIKFRLFNIGFVFQSYNLIPVLTALENVEFILFLQKINRKERYNKALELLKKVGLEYKKDSKPAQLSGGEQQRVAVARALASNPAFVLADEPTANLDFRSAENLLDLMQNLNKEYNTTFIFSTHDPRVIKRAQRIVTLEDGLIINDQNNI